MTPAADVSVDARPLDAARPVRVLLWDADGVLQHPPRRWTQGVWSQTLESWGGPGFAELLFAAELPALRGEVPFRDALARLLDEHPQVTAGVGDLLGLWEQVERDEDALRLVAEVAASGVSCVLATNQQDHRKEYLRRTFGYDGHFERSFYSCDLGAMKPEPAYFERVLEALGVDPADADEVGFVDDNLANVETALSLGIRAVHHDPASGVAGLRATLGWGP